MIETATGEILSSAEASEEKQSRVFRGLYGIRTAIWEMWAEFRHE